MAITTSQGHRVELLEAHGRSTPFYYGDYVAIRVAVDGVPCPCMSPAKEIWDMEMKTLSEPEFWQNVADYALTMKDAESVGLRK